MSVFVIFSFVAAGVLTILGALGELRLKRGRLLSDVDGMLGRAVRALGGGRDGRGDASWVLTGGGRSYRLTACDPIKNGHGTYHLGTGVRTTESADGSVAGAAFRQRGDAERGLATLPHVVLGREGTGDRIAKAFGLNPELQTGDARFDELVYVEHDGDREVVDQLLSSSELREAILAAIESGATVVANEQGHAIALRWKRAAVPEGPGPLNEAGRHLAAIADLWPPVAKLVLRRPRNPVWAFASRLAGVAGGALAILACTMLVPRVEPLDRAYFVATLATIVAVVLVVLVVGFLVARGRTGARTIMYWALFGGVVGVPPLASSSLALANASGIQATETRAVAVARTRSVRNKSSTSCYVDLVPWEPAMSTPSQSIACSEVRDWPVGGEATATVGRGRLGWQWLAAVQRPKRPLPTVRAAPDGPLRSPVKPFRPPTGAQ